MEEKKSACKITFISEKLPLYKDNNLADKVEMVKLQNLGYPMVVEKELYNVGDRVLYIQPDYCIPNNKLFSEYVSPDGDSSKSKLGKIEGVPSRIRAKKFNLSIGDGVPVYSYGIIYPINTIINYLMEIGEMFSAQDLKFSSPLYTELLDEKLGIKKYEEVELVKIGKGNGLPFPTGIYKTDEENILNIVSKIQFPITLNGTQKIDGSSITIGVTPEIPEGFICSRTIRKPLRIRRITGYRHMFSSKKLSWIEKIYDKIFEVVLRFPNDRNIYVEEENNDVFVQIGLPYLEDILRYEDNLILRGELNGGGCKGSGNKNNPSCKEKVNIKFFSINRSVNGTAKKVHYRDFIAILNDLYFNSENMLEYNSCPLLFTKVFNNFKEIEDCCNDYFKNNLIEGIVLSTPENDFSAKFMNLEYDSKK